MSLVTNVVIRAAEGFNLQCNNVARQVEEKCFPYYRTSMRVLSWCTGLQENSHCSFFVSVSCCVLFGLLYRLLCSGTRGQNLNEFVSGFPAVKKMFSQKALILNTHVYCKFDTLLSRFKILV